MQTATSYSTETQIGGWAAVLRYGEHAKDVRGIAYDTSLTELRLLAVAGGLGALRHPVRVTVHSPSAGVRPVAESGKSPDHRWLSESLAHHIQHHDVTWNWDGSPVSQEDQDRIQALAALSIEEAEAQQAELPHGNIREALDKFLAAQRARLPAQTFAQWESVIGYLSRCFNNYGSLSLDAAETERFDIAYGHHLAGDAFSRMFGPEKIPANIWEFTHTYMAKVIDAPRIFKAVGPVLRALAEWLAAGNYGLNDEDVADMIDEADIAAYALPAADLVQELWNRHADATYDPDAFEFTSVNSLLLVSGVEPGVIHFEDYLDDDFYSITVPKEISDLVKTGWTIFVEASFDEDNEIHVRGIGRIYT